MKHVLILGAGIGGLSAAIHLAAKGCRVTILEQNSATGGKMSEIRAEGYRWDTGPSVITMRRVFEDLFRAANRKMEDYLTLLPVEPLTRYFYADGTRLDLTRDTTRVLKQIHRLNPRDVEGYLAFLSSAAKLHRITAPVFTYGPPPSLSSFKKITLRDLLSFDPIHSLQWSIERHVQHPHLRQLLGRFATYVGASPYLAPAALAVVAHVEINEGIWYPQGGIYSIARAYETLARELGAEIQLNARVKQIRLNGKKVGGVTLESGETIQADCILSNIDVTTTYNLIDSPVIEKRRRQLQQRELSSSGMILLLGIQGSFPELAHHNIFFSEDYRRENEQIFREHSLPEDPTLYICITSKTDASHAPNGCENWFVMANSPALSEETQPGDSTDEAAKKILLQLEKRGLDVKGKIRWQKLITPRDIAVNTGAYRGALYGVSFNDRLAPFRRPRNKSEIDGLFFAGGTTHPGGGVSMVTLSGKLAAELICG